MHAAASCRALAGNDSAAHLGERGSAPQANVRSRGARIIDYLGDVALLTERPWIKFEPTHVLSRPVAFQTLMREKNSDGGWRWPPPPPSWVCAHIFSRRKQWPNRKSKIKMGRFPLPPWLPRRSHE